MKYSFRGATLVMILSIFLLWSDSQASFQVHVCDETTPIPLRLEGNFPGGGEHFCERFAEIYPFLVEYMGEPMDPSYRTAGLTWTWEDSITNADGRDWDAANNTVHNGPVPGMLDPPNYPELPRYTKAYLSYEHETAHLFYDLGSSNLAFDFEAGQWLWESMALVGQTLAYSKPYGELLAPSGMIVRYDTVSNVGHEALNGVKKDRDKYDRGIVDSNGNTALRLMTEVLSHDTNFDLIRKLNAELLLRYNTSQKRELTIADFKAALNKVAAGKRIDGLDPASWLFTQPVANNDGVLGKYLIIVPFYSGPPSGSEYELIPTRFEFAAFERMAGARAGEPREISFENLDVTLRILNASGQVLREGKFKTGRAGLGEVDSFSNNSLVNTRGLPVGTYIIEARATHQGQQLIGRNFFPVVSNREVRPVELQDDRLFIVPLNADGSNVRPELVEQIEVRNGEIATFPSGVLIVRAKPGDAVVFSFGGTEYIISKPVTSRLVPLYFSGN